MTIEEIIKKYNIRIHENGTQLRADMRISKNPDDLAFMKENKPAIIDYIKSKKEAEEKAYQERKAKIDAIEGLKEIRDAIADLSRWHEEFEESFNDVGGLGVRPKPDYDIDGMKKKYPREAAYLKAESYEYASHYHKSSLGKDAKEKIINGEDCAEAISEMEQKWKEYCDEHIWD